jgi:hypothetical protein
LALSTPEHYHPFDAATNAGKQEPTSPNVAFTLNHHPPPCPCPPLPLPQGLWKPYVQQLLEAMMLTGLSETLIRSLAAIAEALPELLEDIQVADGLLGCCAAGLPDCWAVMLLGCLAVVLLGCWAAWLRGRGNGGLLGCGAAGHGAACLPGWQAALQVVRQGGRQASGECKPCPCDKQRSLGDGHGRDGCGCERNLPSHPHR